LRPLGSGGFGCAKGRPADDEQTAAEIDVRQCQSRDLANTQPESIEEGEYRRVGSAAMGRPVIVRQRGRDLNEPAGMRQVEKVRDGPGGLATRSQSKR